MLHARTIPLSGHVLLTVLELLLFICVFCVFADADSSCIGIACGNAQLSHSRDASAPTAKITILVYSTYVGLKPINIDKLNHKVYCDAQGYEYKHFYFTPEAFAKTYTSQPGSWLAVYAAKELLASSSADYFFRISIDTVFMRTDIRLESIIDPLQKYSFYGTSMEPRALDVTKDAWMLKRSDFSKALIGEWLEYVAWGGCGSLNGEEGGMYLTLGTAYKWQAAGSASGFDCPHMCKYPADLFLICDWCALCRQFQFLITPFVCCR
jgi:hypothetical protein